MDHCDTSLTDPPPGADFEHWDRCCDRCGEHVPEGHRLYCGVQSVTRADGSQVIVTYGVCPACLDKP